MLPPILFAVLSKTVALFDTYFNSLKDILDGNREAVKNSAPPSSPFEVAPITNESSVIPKERPVDLHPTDPEGGLGGERDASRFYPSTFLLRVQHDLPALPVQLVEAPPEGALRFTRGVQLT